MDNNESQKTFRLPVIETILAAFLILWERRHRFAIALLVPTVLLILINAVACRIISVLAKLTDGSTMAIPEDQMIFFSQHSSATVLVVFFLLVISTVTYVFYAITVHRLILLGNESVPRYGQLKWTWRETRFLAWGIVIGIVSAIVFLILFMLLSVFILPFSAGSREHVLSIVYLIVLIPVTYLVCCWTLILPAVAVDKRPSLGSAWELSRKNGWRLVFTISTFPVILALMRSMLPIQGVTITSYALDQLFFCFDLIVGISSLSGTVRTQPRQSLG